jgi:ribosomal protein L11 methyltransferase
MVGYGNPPWKAIVTRIYREVTKQRIFGPTKREQCMPDPHKRETGTRLPYGNLHIAILRGLVMEADEAILGKAFIGRWLEDDTSFLFFSEPYRMEVLELLKMRPDLELMEEHRFTYEEWHGGRLEPTRVERFLIIPPWENAEIEAGVIPIVLDPGVVFGTGLHPTTRDCLRALVFLRDRTLYESVLDLGTGTGILAVASALLGAKRVLAVDLNPLCAKTAEHNVELNQLKEVIQVMEGRVEDFAGWSADLIIANLHYDALTALTEAKVFQSSSWFIFSGLLRSQASRFTTRLRDCGLHLVREWDHENTWFTLLATPSFGHYPTKECPSESGS